jgi:ureidoglycolate hydrolase
MTKTYSLTVELMEEESFKPFGELWHATEKPADHRIISPTTYDHDGKSTVEVIWQPKSDLRFHQLERHFGVTQSFVQLSGGTSVVCVAAPTDPDNLHDIPSPEDVRAFLVDPTVGYCFRRGTWHSLDRYILNDVGAIFLIINSSPNPTQLVNYQTGQGFLSKDLDVDHNPKVLQYNKISEIDFEIEGV